MTPLKRFMKKHANKHANFNIKDLNKRTPLHFASECGNLNMVKFLLE